MFHFLFLCPGSHEAASLRPTFLRASPKCLKASANALSSKVSRGALLPCCRNVKHMLKICNRFYIKILTKWLQMSETCLKSVPIHGSKSLSQLGEGVAPGETKI